MRDLLVTGTDTGIGKTIIAAALVRALRARNIRAVGFKPAETGLEDGQPADSDLLAEASGERSSLTTPLLRLAEALAPAVAAERAGIVLRAPDIEARVEALRRAGFSLVIEGAGGVMVPLCWDAGTFFTVLDLAERCGLDAVIVARAGLGTLNHIALTVAMLTSRKIAIRGVVLNGRRMSEDTAEATNSSVLARMLPDLPIIEVPYHAGPNVPDIIDAAVPYVGSLL